MTNAAAVPVAGPGPAVPSPVADADERTRDRVLAAVLEHGPVSAAEGGDLLGSPRGAVRRPLPPLSRAGVIEVRRAPNPGAGAGPPARRYVLSSQGQSSLG